ncbi:MAG: sigma-70 family RNA polymerase sigma factor [Myxococcota bacterium]
MSLTLVHPSEPSSHPTVEEVYEEHYELVYRLGLRYGSGRTQWAEDIAHDVFLKLFAAPERLEQLSNIPAWLYRVTTNTCLNRLAKERWIEAAPVRWLLRSTHSPVPDPETLGISSARLKRLFEVVHRMPPKHRTCFFMYFVDNMTQPEIAEVLGCTKSYVCKLLTRVRQQLAAFEEDR